MSVQNMQESCKAPTQCERIGQYIKDFGSITTLEAITDIGVLRLGARISEMRKCGENIRGEREYVRNRYKQRVPIMRYFLEDVDVSRQLF